MIHTCSSSLADDDYDDAVQKLKGVARSIDDGAIRTQDGYASFCECKCEYDMTDVSVVIDTYVQVTHHMNYLVGGTYAPPISLYCLQKGEIESDIGYVVPSVLTIVMYRDQLERLKDAGFDAHRFDDVLALYELDLDGKRKMCKVYWEIIVVWKRDVCHFDNTYHSIPLIKCSLLQRWLLHRILHDYGMSQYDTFHTYLQTLSSDVNMLSLLTYLTMCSVGLRSHPSLHHLYA